MHRARRALRAAALIAFGILLALATLELALRAGGWAFLQSRTAFSAIPSGDGETFRILCLGESTTADLGVLPRHGYPFQLQRILNTNTTGRRFVVFNGGVPATTTDQIVERLPELLDRHRPDLVVAMMGVNDGPLSDPLFAVSTGRPSLRVLRLFDLLRGLRRGAVGSGGGEDELRIQPVPLIDGRPDLRVAPLTMFELHSAGIFLKNGKLDRAEEILLPLAEGTFDGDMRVVTTGAIGQLALLNYQRGNVADGDFYHARFRELVDQRHNPKTTANYRVLHRMLRDSGVGLVAMQYPGRAVAPLRRVLGDPPDVLFVDNEELFLDAVKSRPVGELFRDLFAGNFGHLTPEGNRILATNLARALLDFLGARDPVMSRPG